MDKREINRKPPVALCKSRQKAKGREGDRGNENGENVRVKDINTGRFSPLSVKRATERETGGMGNVLSSVHVEKGVCNAVESSGAKSQMESTCATMCRDRQEKGKKRAEEESAIGSSGRTSAILN